MFAIVVIVFILIPKDDLGKDIVGTWTGRDETGRDRWAMPGEMEGYRMVLCEHNLSCEQRALKKM